MHWMGGSPYDDLDDLVRGIQQKGFSDGLSDIAYNWLVGLNGDIFEGRGWGFESGANGDSKFGDGYANDHYYAICFIHGPDEKPTDAAKASTILLIKEGMKVFRDLTPMIVPHRYWHGTECPGNDWINWINGEPWERAVPVKPMGEDGVEYTLLYPDKPFKAGQFKDKQPTFLAEGKGGVFAYALNREQVKKAKKRGIPGPVSWPLDKLREDWILRDSRNWTPGDDS